MPSSRTERSHWNRGVWIFLTFQRSLPERLEPWQGGVGKWGVWWMVWGCHVVSSFLCLSLYHKTTNTVEQLKSIWGWWRRGGHRMATDWSQQDTVQESLGMTLRLTVGHVPSWNLSCGGRNEEEWSSFSFSVGNVFWNWVYYRALWGKAERKQRPEPQSIFVTQPGFLIID